MNITPETTRQEIFDHVWKHFITEENPRSTSDRDTGSCMYRGPGGRRCAAGLFIPDDKYSPRAEGRSIATVVKDLNLDWTPEQLGIMRQMQSCHDGYASRDIDVFTKRLRTSAELNGLEVPA